MCKIAPGTFCPQCLDVWIRQALRLGATHLVANLSLSIGHWSAAPGQAVSHGVSLGAAAVLDDQDGLYLVACTSCVRSYLWCLDAVVFLLPHVQEL